MGSETQVTVTTIKSRSAFRNRVTRSIIAASMVIWLGLPKPVLACENFAVPLATAGVIAGLNTALLIGMQTAIKALWKSVFSDMDSDLDDSQNDMKYAIIGCHDTAKCGTLKDGRLDILKGDLKEAMEDMTQQISGSLKDQTRQLGTARDAAEMNRTARKLQKKEAKVRRELRPSDESCRYDTAALALRQTAQIAKGVTRAYSNRFSQMGSNVKGSLGAAGPGGVRIGRFTAYQSVACDPKNNAGNAGCIAAPPPAYANMNVTPSKTYFGKETIDLTDPNMRTVVDELTYNITGYQVPQPMQPEVLNTSAGKDQRLRNNAYMAQMDAVVALPAMIVAERTPGAADADIKKLRNTSGVSDASDRPSEREIRQAKIEELWSPRYYSRLGSSTTEIARKELYLQALNVAQLYRLIEKTEKIGMVFAAETGNLVDQADTSRGSENMQMQTREQ